MNIKPYSGTHGLNEHNDMRFTNMEISGIIPYGLRTQLYEQALALGEDLWPNRTVKSRFNLAMRIVLDEHSKDQLKVA